MESVNYQSLKPEGWLQKILFWSIFHRGWVVSGSLLLMVSGYVCFHQLQIEAYPDIADTNVMVIAPYPGLAAEEVEKQVTLPIERALQNTPGILDLRSRTIFGLAVVQLTFIEGTNDYFARQQVLEKLASLDLPEGVQPELAPLSTAVGEIFRYAVEGPPGLSPSALRDLQDWVIRPFLLQTPGVADIITFGGPRKQYQVLVDPNQLRKYNLRLVEVEEAILSNNKNSGGQTLRMGSQGFAVRGLGRLQNLEDLQHIVLKASNGVPICLKDVATVEISPPPPNGFFGYRIPSEGKDVSQGIEGIVLLRRHENPDLALRALKERIELLEKEELPEDVKLRTLYDRSFLIDHSLHTVGKTLIEGISIVVIVLVLLLGSIRSALVVALTIPFSLLFAFLAMYWVNIPANLLSLGAIDFGILVDGACLMTEHVTRHLKGGKNSFNGRNLQPAVFFHGAEVTRALFFSITIIILAYLPILLMTRVEGKLFSPMALTLGFAVVGSLLAALTLVPVVLTMVWPKNLPVPKPWLASFQEKWRTWLTQCFDFLFKKPVMVASLGGLFVVSGFVIGSQLGTEFLPELDEGAIFLRANLPAGVAIQENAEYAPKIRDIIGTFPEVDFVITQTGRNDDGTDPFPANRNEILIGLKPYNQWNTGRNKRQLTQSIRHNLEHSFPGIRFSTGQPIIDQVMEIVTGSAADLAVSVVGDDLNLMRSQAEILAELMRAIPGSEGVNIEQEGPQDQITLTLNRHLTARHGISGAEVQFMVEAAIGGKEIDELYVQDRKYPISIRYLPQYRDHLTAIQELIIPSATGAILPLQQVANIQFSPGQTTIYRRNNKRMITVRTNIRGRDQGGFVAELKDKMSQMPQLPSGYQWVFGGQYENLERAGKQLVFTIPLTLMIVFALLFLLYQDVKRTLLNMACVLFALAGGLWALYFRGYYLNVSAGVGFISISGISVMAGVILLSAYQRANPIGSLNENDIFQTTLAQLRAISSILLLAILGLVPAALSTGIGSDIQRPMATVIIGGLLSTWILTPTLLPILYRWIYVKSS